MEEAGSNNLWQAKQVFSKCAAEFYSLFGDKCLPDKAEEIADKCIEPVKEHFEKENLNLSQLSANCDKSKRKALYDALCKLESASLKVRKALVAF